MDQLNPEPPTNPVTAVPALDSGLYHFLPFNGSDWIPVRVVDGTLYRLVPVDEGVPVADILAHGAFAGPLPQPAPMQFLKSH